MSPSNAAAPKRVTPVPLEQEAIESETTKSGPGEDESTAVQESAPEQDTGQDTEQDGQTDSSPNREAAKWRRRLRDTESERDKLAETVTTLQRQQVESMLGGRVRPAALWAVSELSEMLNESGSPTPELVEAAIEKAKLTLGIRPAMVHPASLRSGAANTPPRQDPWEKAFARPER